MTLDQYMLSILSLRNEIPILQNRDDMLEMMFKNIQLDMFKQLQISYIAKINDMEFSINPQILYEIISEISLETNGFYKEFSKEYLSIFFQMFYW